MAAVLAFPEGAILSHSSAAALWNLSPEGPRIEVSLPRSVQPAQRTRSSPSRDPRRPPTSRDAMTSRSHVAMPHPHRHRRRASRLASWKRSSTALTSSTSSTPRAPRRRGWTSSTFQAQPKLRALLDRATFRLTDSELERMFLRLVGQARSAAARNAGTAERLPGRLLLARSTPRGRDRRPALPPHRGHPGTRRPAGPRRMLCRGLDRLCASRYARGETIEPEAVAAATRREALRTARRSSGVAL